MLTSRRHLNYNQDNIKFLLHFIIITNLRLYPVADLDQNYWGSQNNILKIYIFNINVTNSIKNK